MPWATRLATAADVPAIRALVESAYRGEAARAGWTHEADLIEGDRTSEAEVAALVAASDHRIVVIEQAGRIVGSVTVAHRGAGLCYLGMLAVAPGLQGRGIGRTLLAAAEREATSSFSATRMEMTVIARRVKLIEWYQRCGYRRSGEQRPFPLPVANADELVMDVLERAPS